MSEAKHTKGPWTVGCRYTQTGVYSAGDTLVAETHGAQRNYERDAQIAEQDANARLIAAAPDLLEAAQIAEAVICNADAHDDEKIEAVMLLQAAIAKAKGLSPSPSMGVK